MITYKYFGIAVVAATFVFINNASAQVAPLDLRGMINGTGTHFAITDSAYLNVVLDSSEEISLFVQSAPEMITMTMGSVSSVTTTRITISGLTPNTTFYKYQDDYHNLESFIADINGTYSYEQDVSTTHYIFIQPTASTKFIADNGTGGDCTTIGTWNSATKTCTLTTDVFETIQIDSSGITLDGNSHTITGSNTGSGVFVNGKSNVVIKNVNSQQFFYGISLISSSGSEIKGNTVANVFGTFGIWLQGSNNNKISGNLSQNECQGIFLGFGSSNNELSGNTISGPFCSGGITVYAGSDGNVISGNHIFNYDPPLWISGSSNNVFSGNTFEATNPNASPRARSIVVENGVGNQIFQNNILGYGGSNYGGIPVFIFGGSDNALSLPSPIGGNYWSNFDTPGEGCNPTDENDFCTSPLVFSGAHDNAPWTKKNSWVRPPLYTQIASPYPSFTETQNWATELYGNGNYADCNNTEGVATIQGCGCVITSSVMLLRYYGIISAIDGRDANPSNINSWSINNGGYNSIGDLVWSKLVEYSKTSPTGLARIHFDGGFDGGPGTYGGLLDSYVNAEKPTILKVQVPTSGGGLANHYLVSDGKRVTTYRVRDPLMYNTDQLNEPVENLANRIRAYSNNFGGLRLFSALSGPIDGISFNIASPAELVITDPLGRRVGTDPVSSSSFSEIPGASYFADGVSDISVADPTPSHVVKTAFIPQPLDGDYGVQVIGTGEGDYTFSSLAYDASSTPYSTTLTGVISTGEVSDYELSYSTTTPEDIVVREFYRFSGFLPPVRADGSGIYELGRTLPIKFQLKDAQGQFVANATVTLALAMVNDGMVGSEEVPLSTSAVDTGNIFRYDSENSQYIYNLDTGILTAGTWQLKASVDDGKSYVVLVSLRN